MAYLNYFEIESETKQASDAGTPFRVTLYHVKEIVRHFLPEKFVLDGSSKFQITLCEGVPDFVVRTVLGTTEYKVGGFDFLSYFLLTPSQQEERIVDVILSAFAAYVGADSPACRALELACAKARELKFHLRYEVDKLRKSVRRQRVTVRVFRILSYEVGECWEAQVEAADNVVFRDTMKSSTYVDLTSYYKSPKIENTVYVIRDRFEKIAYSFDLEEFCDK